MKMPWRIIEFKRKKRHSNRSFNFLGFKLFLKQISKYYYVSHSCFIPKEKKNKYIIIQTTVRYETNDIYISL